MFRVRGATGNKKNNVTSALQYYMSIRPGNVSAGILENGTYPDGISIPLVAFWMEYGTRSKGKGGTFHSPPRPFLRNTARAHRNEWRRIYLAAMQRRTPSETVLKRIGALMAGQIRQSITTFTDPGNAPATIKRKGMDAPLRDTGVLLNAISWEYTQNVQRRGLEHQRIGE